MKIINFLICLFSISVTKAQENSKQAINKNGMEVTWFHKNNQIQFSLEAPTAGWVGIGFNNSQSIKGTYLILGNVINNKTTVVEHYTLNPGNYKPVHELGATPKVKNISGEESNNITKIRFSLPNNSWGKYQKDLSSGKSYFLIIAYSQEDDFQHHSMMRTSLKITL